MSRLLSLCALIVLTSLPVKGQELLRDLETMPLGMMPQDLTAVGQHVYFTGIGPEGGREWWRTDGTGPGTHMVADLAPGDGSINPKMTTVIGSELYFWDGISQSLVVINDADQTVRSINGLATDDRPYWIGSYQDGAVLVHHDQEDPIIHIIPAGSDSATRLPVSCAEPCNVIHPQVVGNALYFVLEFGQTRRELWRVFLDGSWSEPLPVSTDRYAEFIGSIGNKVLFVNRAEDGTYALYSWTGGTLSQLATLSGPGDRISTNPLAISNGRFILLTDTNRSQPGFQMIATDGTPEATEVLLGDADWIWPRTVQILPNGNIVFANYDDTYGQELWVSDGTTEGTHVVADVRPGRDGSSPEMLQVIGDHVYYCAYDPVHGVEFWRSDGTEAGTRLVADLIPGEMGGNPEYFIPLGSEILISSWDGEFGNQLIAVEPESGDTRTVTTLSRPITRSSSPRAFVEIGSEAVFSASNKLEGSQRWISDGSFEGTRRLSIPGLPEDSYLRYLTKTESFIAWSAGGGFLFRDLGNDQWTYVPMNVDGRLGEGGFVDSPWVATSPDEILVGPLVNADGEIELWASDGTEAGTRRVDPGRDARYMNPVGWVDEAWIIIQNPFVYRLDDAGLTRLGFQPDLNGSTRAVATDSLLYLYEFNDPGLWATDGTEAGTRYVSASAGFEAGHAMIHGALVTSDKAPGTAGRELTIRIGADSVRTIADLAPGSLSSTPRHITGWNDRAVFTARVNGGDRQLWITDGTEAGTQALIEDLEGGGAEDYHDVFVFLAGDENGFLFSVRHGRYGREPWYSDGTKEGTVLLADLVPGREESRPRFGGRASNQLLFSATIPEVGTELFAVSLAYLATDTESLAVLPEQPTWGPGYPNPAHSSITFPGLDASVGSGSNSALGVHARSIRVFDLLGRRHVVPADLSDGAIRLETARLPAGVYFVEIMEGDRREIRRFVRQ